MAQILVFGDSITYGAWDTEGGWVQRLRRYLDARTLSDPDSYYLVYNLGVSGDTTEDLLERLGFETKQRLDEEEEAVFIFAIGENDSAFINKRKRHQRHQVEPKDFERNVLKLIRLARKYASKIVFVGLVPVDDAKVDPVPWRPEISYRNEYISAYNRILKAVCRKRKIPFVDVFDELAKEDYKHLLEDGAHPNSRGHRKIFESVKSFLEDKKIIR